MTQVLPFADAPAMEVFGAVERAVYAVGPAGTR